MNESNTNETLQLFQIVMDMSEGNPGAVNYVMDMIKKGETDRKYLSIFTWLYANHIKGERLYKLINDCCKSNYYRLMEVITSNIGITAINSHIDHGVRGLEFSAEEVPVSISNLYPI